MRLWGRDWTRQELEQRVGSISQLGGVTRFELSSGKARGVRALRVKTATGLEFTVLEDRGLDIVEASFQGRSLCWHSPIGVVHPAYYDASGIQWLKSFAGGLLATCGLSNAGVPCVDQGEEFGLHGVISNTPAEQCESVQSWEGDELRLAIHGRVREAHLHGPNLVLERSIETSLGSNAIQVRDSIRNEGSQPAPLMLLYHCNFGFPLLTERSRVYASPVQTEPRTEFARGSIDAWSRFEPPQNAIEERCYYHSFPKGDARVVLVDDEQTPSLGVQMTYDASALPYFIQWKFNRTSQYVMGLEPGNCRIDGRDKERPAGRLRMLAPGEEFHTRLEWKVLDSAAQIDAAIAASGAGKC